MRRTPLKRILSGVWEVARVAVHCRRMLSWARRFIASHDPAMVFSGPYASCAMIDDAVEAACIQAEKPHFCLSYAYFMGKKVRIGSRMCRLEGGQLNRGFLADATPLGRVLSRLFPQWIAESDGVRLFPHDPVRMLGARVGGLLPDDPWMAPSTGFDRIFVFSEFTKRLLVDSGYPPEKTVVAGQPALDEVIERLGENAFRSDLFEYLGIDENQPFVLVNIEPAKEHGYASAEKHWENLHGLMRSISILKSKLILSLHPLCDPNEYVHLEEEYACKISIRYGISFLYPLAQLVVSMPCNTNYLSTVFEKDLIIYDFYREIRKHSFLLTHAETLGAKIANKFTDLDAIIAEFNEESTEYAEDKPHYAFEERETSSKIIYDSCISYLT